MSLWPVKGLPKLSSGVNLFLAPLITVSSLQKRQKNDRQSGYISTGYGTDRISLLSAHPFNSRTTPYRYHNFKFKETICEEDVSHPSQYVGTIYTTVFCTCCALHWNVNMYFLEYYKKQLLLQVTQDLFKACFTRLIPVPDNKRWKYIVSTVHLWRVH
jgi:hypothetical protein